MSMLWWGMFAGVWVAIVAYLIRCIVNVNDGHSTPGDDLWREFWKDAER